ncbi:EF-hand domain-containing protein [Actinomadura vinacea]|uniref:EF-hand domain-containing protein n=1 Tax=Actinomadura vinacea TaxID=115336 RepID=A0ABP5VS09_9ACTN
MAAGTIARKADHWFVLLDVNGDGQVQRSDMRALGERILNHFGQSPDSPQGRKLLQAYDESWDYMVNAMDTDGDNAISREEFRNYMSKNANRANADEALRPLTDAEFAVTDTDSDGYLSPDEYAEFLRAWGLSDQDARLGASSIDTDRDGRISREEYFRACRDFFAGGENLSEPAGQVFGRV